MTQLCQHFGCRYAVADKFLDAAKFTEAFGYDDRDPMVQHAHLCWRETTSVKCQLKENNEPAL